MRAVCGGLEAPAQMVTILYLIIRGLLPLPWTQPASASCIQVTTPATSLCPRYTWICCQDSLGRVACLPSVPVASLSLSLVSLVKAMHDLNLGPLVAGPTSLRRLRLSARLGLGLLPCLLATAVFRIAAAR